MSFVPPLWCLIHLDVLRMKMAIVLLFFPFSFFFLKRAEAKDLSNEKWEFIHLCIYCHFPFI